MMSRTSASLAMLMFWKHPRMWICLRSKERTDKRNGNDVSKRSKDDAKRQGEQKRKPNNNWCETVRVSDHDPCPRRVFNGVFRFASHTGDAADGARDVFAVKRLDVLD